MDTAANTVLTMEMAMRSFKIFLLLVFLVPFFSAKAEDSNTRAQKAIIESAVKDCLENPDRILQAIVNPELRAKIEGRRYPAFCNCFANAFFTLIDERGAARAGKIVQNDSEVTKKLLEMTIGDLTLYTYQRCTKLVINKIP